MGLGIGAVVEHPEYGEGAVFAEGDKSYRVFFKDIGEKSFSKDYSGFEVLEDSEFEDTSISMDDVVSAVKTVFEEYHGVADVVELGDKWEGGVMILKPGQDNLQSKEIPIETFFHKIVMLRDRLRVLEQNINSNKKLTDEDKVNLQQYITRIYGSLTTFNVLFRNKEDHFIGGSA
jgi:hypothetical protein